MHGFGSHRVAQPVQKNVAAQEGRQSRGDARRLCVLTCSGRSCDCRSQSRPFCRSTSCTVPCSFPSPVSSPRECAQSQRRSHTATAKSTAKSTAKGTAKGTATQSACRSPSWCQASSSARCSPTCFNQACYKGSASKSIAKSFASKTICGAATPSPSRVYIAADCGAATS